MGLFDKFRKKEKSDIRDSAYRANPHFYAKEDGSPFFFFFLTEGTETILPENPRYAVNGKEIAEYRLMLVSITKDSVIGDLDYFHEALGKLEEYIIDSNETEILVRGLTLEELQGLLSDEKSS